MNNLEEQSDFQDEEDIYGNLPEYEQYDAKFEQLEKSNETLRCQLQHLEGKVEELTKTNKKLSKMEKALSRNISVLFATALTEVEHKDRMITELRRERDSLIFRRAQTSENRTNAVASVSAVVSDKVTELPAIQKGFSSPSDPRLRPSSSTDTLGRNKKHADESKVSRAQQADSSVVTRRASHTHSKKEETSSVRNEVSNKHQLIDTKATKNERPSKKISEPAKTSDVWKKSSNIELKSQRSTEESAANINKAVCADNIASSQTKGEIKNRSKEVCNEQVNPSISPVTIPKTSSKEHPSNNLNLQGDINKELDVDTNGKNNFNSASDPKLLELPSHLENVDNSSTLMESVTNVGTTDMSQNIISTGDTTVVSSDTTIAATSQLNTAGDNGTTVTSPSSTAVDPEPVSLLRQTLLGTEIPPEKEALPQKFRIPKVKGKVAVEEHTVSVLERAEVKVPRVERRYEKIEQESPPNKEPVVANVNSSVNVSISSSTECELSVRRKSRVKIVCIKQNDEEQTQVTKRKRSIDVSEETARKVLCFENEENVVHENAGETRNIHEVNSYNHDREDNSHIVHSGDTPKNNINVGETSAKHTFNEKRSRSREDSREIIHERNRGSSSEFKRVKHKDSFTEEEHGRHKDGSVVIKYRKQKISSPDVRQRVQRDFSPDVRHKVHRDNSAKVKQGRHRDSSPDLKHRGRHSSLDRHREERYSSPDMEYREERDTSPNMKHREERDSSQDGSQNSSPDQRDHREQNIGKHRGQRYGTPDVKLGKQRDNSPDLKHRKHRESPPEVRHNEQRQRPDSPEVKSRRRREMHEEERRLELSSFSRDLSPDRRHHRKSRSENEKSDKHSLPEFYQNRRCEEDIRQSGERRHYENNTRLRRSTSRGKELSNHNDFQRPSRHRRRSPSYEERRDLHRDEKRPRMEDSIERELSEQKYRIEEALKRLQDEKKVSSYSSRHRRSMSHEEDNHCRSPPHYRKMPGDRERYEAKKQKEYSSKQSYKKLDDSEKRPSQQSKVLTCFDEGYAYPERGLRKDRSPRSSSSQRGQVDLRDKLKIKKFHLREIPQRDENPVDLAVHENRETLHDYHSQDEHSSEEYQNTRDLKKKRMHRRSDSQEIKEHGRRCSVSDFELHPEDNIFDSEDDGQAKECSLDLCSNKYPETDVSETFAAITVKKRKLPPKLESTELHGEILSVQPTPARESSESEKSLEDVSTATEVHKISPCLVCQHSTMGEPKRYFINSMQDHSSGENVTIMESQWRTKILQTLQEICQGQPPLEADGDGGLYVGVGGVAYMFYHLSQSDVLTDRRDELLCRGLEYATAAIKYVEKQREDPGQKSALLLGDAGVHAVAAAIYLALGDSGQADPHLQAYAAAASNCKAPNFLACGGDELFVGRAGYLLGLLWLQGLCKRPVLPQRDLFEICSTVVASGRSYSKRHRSPCPLMFSYYQVEYLGAAHGLCAILQALLSVPGFLNSSPEAERDVRTSVDWLLSLQGRAGNFPCATDELGARARPDEEQLVHWCHGAPGVVYLMAKAYLVWKDEKYLRSCLKCGELVWTKGLLKKGPGICHGVAGSGYVFLLLFRLTGDQRHLHRAQAFAHFLDSEQFLHGARSPDCPYSLYEGVAGTCCFLADLTQPQRAAFPLYDVF